MNEWQKSAVTKAKKSLQCTYKGNNWQSGIHSLLCCKIMDPFFLFLGHFPKQHCFSIESFWPGWKTYGIQVKATAHRIFKGPFNTFSKKDFKKGFYRSKLAWEFKFYTWIIIAGSRSLKKGQKMLKKATNLV